jgi:hypothetical protein
MTGMRNFLIGWLCACLVASTAAASAPPTLESVIPAVGHLGAEFTVVLSGGHLKEAKGLLIYNSGLTCTKLEVVSDGEVRATLRSAPNGRPGAYAFRLRTPAGLSELKLVHVSPFEVVVESEPNDDPRGAPGIPLNTTVAGVIDSGDVDCVAVGLRKGQRLAAEVQAVRLGGEMTDTVLTVFGPDHRQLAFVDDTPSTRQDPFTSIVAPADGTYTVLVRDAGFGGGPTSTYALHVGDFPRPTGVFPPGGQAGKEARLRLLGLGNGPAIQTFQLPESAGPWWDYFPALSGRAAPTASILRVRPYACVEDADATETALPVPEKTAILDWPVAFHGTIGGRGDVDAFAVRLVREMLSRSRPSPLGLVHRSIRFWRCSTPTVTLSRAMMTTPPTTAASTYGPGPRGHTASKSTIREAREGPGSSIGLRLRSPDRR